MRKNLVTAVVNAKANHWQKAGLRIGAILELGIPLNVRLVRHSAICVFAVNLCRSLVPMLFMGAVATAFAFPDFVSSGSNAIGSPVRWRVSAESIAQIAVEVLKDLASCVRIASRVITRWEIAPGPCFRGALPTRRLISRAR
jgi:hypothetical protein